MKTKIYRRNFTLPQYRIFKEEIHKKGIGPTMIEQLDSFNCDSMKVKVLNKKKKILFTIEARRIK